MKTLQTILAISAATLIAGCRQAPFDERVPARKQYIDQLADTNVGVRVIYTGKDKFVHSRAIYSRTNATPAFDGAPTDEKFKSSPPQLRMSYAIIRDLPTASKSYALMGKLQSNSYFYEFHIAQNEELKFGPEQSGKVRYDVTPIK